MLFAALLFWLGTAVGCRNAAYTDLYTESMAAEIRDLEDQLYYYDNEYHALEQELESLRAENEKLRRAGQPHSAGAIGPSSLDSSADSPQLEFSPRNRNIVPEPVAKAPPKAPAPAAQAESIVEPPTLGSDQNRAKLEEQLEELPPKRPSLPPSTNDLEIPTIDPGTPMPPGMPVLKDTTNLQGAPPDNTFEMNLSRIEVPGQLASARLNQGQLKLGVEKPSDMRIVEMGFHPILCRAANFDDQSDDDGLVLVLQPKNERGELVPTFADLEITLLDPARQGQAATIGHWKYSAAEVKAKFQPIGSNQGIHLTLPWNGPDPSADRVIVFVYYTLPDGRQVVNDKSIFISGKGSLKTVWVPRAASNSPIVAAGYEAPVEGLPSNVVRPVAGVSEPAPVPQFR